METKRTLISYDSHFFAFCNPKRTAGTLHMVGNTLAYLSILRTVMHITNSQMNMAFAKSETIVLGIVP